MTERFSGHHRPARSLTSDETAVADALEASAIASAHDVIDRLPDSRESAEAIRFHENALAAGMRALQRHGCRGA